MQGAKSSILAGVDGTVASDFISTLSFVTEEQPLILTGERERERELVEQSRG